MDALRRDDILRARATPASVKAKQALSAMSFGIRLQRRKLRAAMPNAPEEAITKQLRAWLRRDDRSEP